MLVRLTVHIIRSAYEFLQDWYVEEPEPPTEPQPQRPAQQRHRIAGRTVYGRSWTMDEVAERQHEEEEMF